MVVEKYFIGGRRLVDEIELHQLIHLELNGFALSYFFMKKNLD
jgi:hypothetical protein